VIIKRPRIYGVSEPIDSRRAQPTDPPGDAPARLTATVASEHAYGLAEGPLWDEERELVLWVDINAGHVHRGSLSGGSVTPAWQLSFDETVGAVACCADGGLLVAGARDVYRVSEDSARERLATIVAAEKASRLNDGACDPAGRYLIGSVAVQERAPQEVLCQVDRDGGVAIIDDDLAISNGLAWSADGSVLYSVDTGPGSIWARPYDPASGIWGSRREIIGLRGESPDGLCADTEGNLWIALWGAGEVRRYTPAGEHLATISVPAPNTTSVAFVGPDLDVLLITTARDELSAAQLSEFPLSGHLFTARVGATGVPTTRWSGA
jgi:sugar lactone lactonase YvrE